MYKKLTINVTEKQNEALDRMSLETGITKNGIICLAVWEWLKRNDEHSVYTTKAQ